MLLFAVSSLLYYSNPRCECIVKKEEISTSRFGTWKEFDRNGNQVSNNVCGVKKDTDCIVVSNPNFGSVSFKSYAHNIIKVYFSIIGVTSIIQIILGMIKIGTNLIWKKHPLKEICIQYLVTGILSLCMLLIYFMGFSIFEAFVIGHCYFVYCV